MIITPKFLKIFVFSCLLLLFYNVKIVEADPYNMNLLDSTCLANDITTGPLGWYCETPDGPFIITFFGINKAGLDGKIIDVTSTNCDSFSINVTDSVNEPVPTNNPPVINNNGSSTYEASDASDSGTNTPSSTNETNLVKEGITSFSHLQIRDDKHFSATKNFTPATSSAIESSMDIQCTYIPPPRKPPE